MIAPALLLALLQDEPAPQQQPWVVNVERLDSRIQGEEVIYTIRGLSVEGQDYQVRAARAEVRLDRQAYQAALAERLGESPDAEQEPAPAQEPEQEKPLVRPGLLAGEWTTRILERLGIPPEQGVLRLLRLEGDVQAAGPNMRLDCASLEYNALSGITEVTQADLRLGQVKTANDWPLRLRADSLEEDPDSSLHAYEAALTTCNRDAPHYELRVREIHATPVNPAQQQWRWAPSGGWLALLGRAVFPVPTPDFTNGESMLGMRSLTALSNDIYGLALAGEFAGQGAVRDDSLRYDWHFYPTVSERRGLPLRGVLDLETDFYLGSWDLFYLHDLGDDVNRLNRFVAREGDERWRARLDNRFDLGAGWRLDADLAVTSDPLVDPEFFNEAWRTEDDAKSELYLRQAGNAGFFETTVTYRLDDAGFTPFSGYPPPGSPAPSTLDTLPRARYDRYSETLLRIPLPGDSELPLNLSWGAEAGHFTLRSRDLDVPPGNPPYTRSPALGRDRARAWTEAALPFHAASAFFRPGVRLSGLAYDEDLAGGEDASRGFFEAFFETGILLEKDFVHGWQHRVLPQVRLRGLEDYGERPGEVPRFDQYDRVRAGQAVELSLRQFYYAPATSQPWVDLDLLIPYYPDPDQPLNDGVFPAPRAGADPAHWGPAELRIVWTPGVYGRTLGPTADSEHARGLQVETRIRDDLHRGELEEFFTRFSVAPHDRLRYGFDFYKVNDLFSTISAYAEYRISSGWGVLARVPYEFTGETSRDAELSFRHYAHDFVVEFGLRRDEASGLSGFSFSVQPRFLVDTPRGVPPER
ncbi:MAG: hypothetical protein EYC70_09185 [Planctomycetota bacterium]|nr:MAG: hypothetical protein EYC70_09185 [Planctomycetota bacterium]